MFILYGYFSSFRYGVSTEFLMDFVKFSQLSNEKQNRFFLRGTSSEDFYNGLEEII